MKTKLAIEMIEDTGMVFDIGQLEPQTKRDLNKLVRKGELSKIRTLWPWRHYGLAEKTAYCMPHCASFYALPKRVASNPSTVERITAT